MKWAGNGNVRDKFHVSTFKKCVWFQNMSLKFFSVLISAIMYL